MPKQNFQRPAPVNRGKFGKQKGLPFGQKQLGRKKGDKPAPAVPPLVKDPARKD